VASEVVVAARCANEAARWVCLQPPLALATIPNAVFGAEHPSPTLAVEDCEVAHGEPERTGLKPAGAALFDQ